MYARFARKTKDINDYLTYRTQGLSGFSIISDAGFTNFPIIDEAPENNPIIKMLGKNTVYSIKFKIFPSFHMEYDPNTEIVSQVDNNLNYSDLSDGSYLKADAPYNASTVRSTISQVKWLRGVFITSKVDDGFKLELFENFPPPPQPSSNPAFDEDKRFGVNGLFNDLDLRYVGGSDVIEASVQFQVGDIGTLSAISEEHPFSGLEGIGDEEGDDII